MLHVLARSTILVTAASYIASYTASLSYKLVTEPPVYRSITSALMHPLHDFILSCQHHPCLMLLYTF